MGIPHEFHELEGTKRVLVLVNPEVHAGVGTSTFHSSYSLSIAGLTKNGDELRWATFANGYLVDGLTFSFWNTDQFTSETTMEEPGFVEKFDKRPKSLDVVTQMFKTLKAIQSRRNFHTSKSGAPIDMWEDVRRMATLFGITETWIPKFPTFQQYRQEYHLVVDMKNNIQPLLDMDQFINERLMSKRTTKWDNMTYLDFAELYGHPGLDWKWGDK